MRAHGVVGLILAVLLAASCAEPSPGAGEDLDGQAVEVLAVWQGVEAAHFRAVLDRFEELTGATAHYTSTAGVDIAEVLDARIAAGRPPDVAILPLPGLLRRYAETGTIRPIDAIVGPDLDRRYRPVWRDLGTVGDDLVGVWFKAAHKSLVWYNVGALEELGAVPPTDFDGLVALAEDLVAAGVPALSVGGADAWTLTDWFENVYLRVAGPDGYDELAEGRRAWTHPTVHEGLRLLGRLFAPDLLAGGVDGALATTFTESVGRIAADPPSAALLPGADFVAGFVPGRLLGVHVDVFLFPEIRASGHVVVGGGDAAALLSDAPAAEALIAYLASAEAGGVWAERGGFVSPNEDVSLERYPDERTRTIARSLLEAGDSFRFDLSDLQPVEFGGTTGAGMLGILQDFLADPGDPAATARRLEAAAAVVRGP